MRNTEHNDVTVTFDEARVILTYWTQALARTYCWPYKPVDPYLPMYEEQYCKERVAYWTRVVDSLWKIFNEQDEQKGIERARKVAGSAL